MLPAGSRKNIIMEDTPLHPDDDSIHAYEPYSGPDRRTPPPPAHCADHARNIEVSKTIIQKMNVLLTGVGILLGCMGWLLNAQITQGQILVAHTETLKNGSASLIEVTRRLDIVERLVQNHEQWLSLFGHAEQFGPSGKERHHEPVR